MSVTVLVFLGTGAERSRVEEKRGGNLKFDSLSELHLNGNDFLSCDEKKDGYISSI